MLVLCALFLVVLTAAGGFAVDLGSWYWNAAKLQRAADAASLAGAPYLPGNLAGAVAAAEDSLKRNGIEAPVYSNTHLTNNVTADDKYSTRAYIAPDDVQPNSLRVELSRSYPTYFTSLLGYNDQYLQRSAKGLYKAKVELGSPGNVVGFDSTPSDSFPQTDLNYNGKYWLTSQGQKTPKDQGDRYMADVCKAGIETDGCVGGVNVERPYGDQDRSHRFTVHVPEGLSGNVMVQVFDPSFVDVGNHCDSNPGLANVTAAAILPAADAAIAPANLYTPGAASPFCTADEGRGLVPDGTPMPTLSIAVHEPSKDKNVLGPTIGNAKTWGGVAWNADPNYLVNQLVANPETAAGFRQWVDVASFSAAEPGDYVVEVKTPDNSGGGNRYALRAGVQASMGGAWLEDASKQVSIAARGHLTVYTNATANETQFYFAKLTSNVASRTLDVNLFDIGDANGQQVNVTLLAPKGAQGSINDPDKGFGTCEKSGPNGVKEIVTPCGLQGITQQVYNGKTVKLRVQIPADYVCEDDGTDKCWMGLQLGLNNGASATNPTNDTTTWEVKACGAPTRLLPEGNPESDCTD